MAETFSSGEEQSGTAAQRRTLPAVAAGVLTGVLTVLFAFSFSALIFGGPLAPFSAQGFSMALASAVIVGAIVAWTSSLPAVIAIPQDRIAPIFALVAANVVSAMPDAVPQRVFLTLVAAILVATAGTGLLLGTLGLLRAGNLVRFVPMPVVGGFLAGSGWLLVTGAIRVMTGETGGWRTIGALFSPPRLLDWAPGAAYGLLLLLLLRRTKKPWLLPALIVAGVAAFFAAAAAAGLSLEDLRARGWLPEASRLGGGFSLLAVRAPLGADWGVLAAQAGSLVTVMLVSLVSLLLNATALELASGRDLELDRELRAAGGANVAAALGGGLVGFHSLSLTGMALRMGAESRLTGITQAGIALAALVLGVPLLSYFPIPIMGALLFLLGGSFLSEWLWDGWYRLPRSDWLIVALIVGVVGTVGYMEGVLVGIAAAVVFFVVGYSRVNVVRHVLSGATHRSNVDRAPADRRLLDEHGDRLHILELQGFLFFGTANLLLERLRRRILDAGRPPVRHVILDLHRVTGLDTSAAVSLGKMRDLCGVNGATISLAQVPPAVQRRIEAAGLRADGLTLFEFPEVDVALERCEDRLLDEMRGPIEEPRLSLDALFTSEGADDELGRVAERYFERRVVPAGTAIVRQGDPSDGLYFVEQGTVSVWLELDGERRTRLRTMRAGTVIGELGLYLDQPRNATVVAESDCTIHRLSRESLRRLLEESPDAAARFHFLMVRILAARLVLANGAIRGLMR